MPTCQNCGNKWSWFDSIKKLITFRKSMKCRHCGEFQFQSAASRNITTFLVLIPLITIPFSVMFQLNLTFSLLLEAVILLVALSIMPLFLKLTSKDEPLW